MQRTVVLVFVMNWSEGDQSIVQQLQQDFSCELRAGRLLVRQVDTHNYPLKGLKRRYVTLLYCLSVLAS
jgi:hypothetical protein